VRHEWVLAALQGDDSALVHGVLVLVQPAVDVVSHRSGVVTQLKVSLVLLLAWLGLAVLGVLAQMSAIQLLDVGLVASLGHDALFL